MKIFRIREIEFHCSPEETTVAQLNSANSIVDEINGRIKQLPLYYLFLSENMDDAFEQISEWFKKHYLSAKWFETLKLENFKVSISYSEGYNNCYSTFFDSGDSKRFLK